MDDEDSFENLDVQEDEGDDEGLGEAFTLDSARVSQRASELDKFVLPQLEQPTSDAGTEKTGNSTRLPAFITWRSPSIRRQEQQVDDVRCMFNMVQNIARPVMQQDAALQEAMVAPRTADQLLLDMQQLGLVREKDGGHGAAGEAAHDGPAERVPILKDLKLIQENPVERPVFHCFLKELNISNRVGTYLVTIEQSDDGFLMMAYEEPLDGQTVMVGTELVRFPKFPQITDGFCLSSNGDIVFTCTLLGCVLYVSLSSCNYEPEASAAEDPEGGSGERRASARRRSSLVSARREARENASRNSSQSSLEGAADQAYVFRLDRSLLVKEANYKLSEPISEHVYDVCLREMSNSAGTGISKCNLYVTNKSNIAVVNMAGLKLDNFLFEGLKLPWRLKLHKNLLIIAEKWGSVQIADLDKEHRSLCVLDEKGLSCEKGLKAIEIVPEHNLLLLTVYPEGNQAAGQGSGGHVDARMGLGGGLGLGGRRWLPGSQHIGESADEAGWSCHCYHFDPESTHGNPVLQYAQTLQLNRSPLSCVYSDATKRLYVLCFHPARNNSALLLMRLEVFHEENVRAVKCTRQQLLQQKDEEEYKMAVDGLARRSAKSDAAKMVEVVDVAGLPIVATMKRPMNFGFV